MSIYTKAVIMMANDAIYSEGKNNRAKRPQILENYVTRVTDILRIDRDEALALMNEAAEEEPQ